MPLLPVDLVPLPAARLNPIFEIGSERCAMLTQFMAAVPTAVLRDQVASLEALDTQITAALDFALTGV